MSAERIRYWASIPIVFVSSVPLANAKVLAMVGDVVSGGQWSQDTRGGRDE